VSGVWLVTGAQGAGKSTVAERLASSFEQGVHVRGGQFYRWAVRGWAHVGAAGVDPWEVRHHLDLRYRLSRLAADEYAAAGFTCVVQDNIYGDDVVRWLDGLVARPRHLVVLRPSVDVVAARDEARRLSTGKVAYRDGFTPAENDRHLATTPAHVGLWLDTSDQTADQTVAELLARADEAVVG